MSHFPSVPKDTLNLPESEVWPVLKRMHPKEKDTGGLVPQEKGSHGSPWGLSQGGSRQKEKGEQGDLQSEERGLHGFPKSATCVGNREDGSHGGFREGGI